MPIYIKPLQIIQFYIDGPNEIPEYSQRKFTIKARCKDGDILDLTENCLISIESQNCGYRINNGKLIISCKEFANDDEVCVVNATFLDEDTNITYYTSKILYISKILYNTFKINFEFENNDQERMITYKNDCLFSIGDLDTGMFNSIKFKVLLYGPSLNTYDETKNVEIYEVGSSYLNIETETVGEAENIEYYKKITLKSLINTEIEKEIILLFVYNEKISGRSIIKPYSIKIFSINSTPTIVSLIVEVSKYVFNENDRGEYSIFGVTTTGEKIDITNSCSVDIFVPINGVILDSYRSLIITNGLSNNSAGYLKASYNDEIIKCENLFFVRT